MEHALPCECSILGGKMIKVTRVDERSNPRPVVYRSAPFSGPAAGASTFARIGRVQTDETVVGGRVLIYTTATGATADVSANANVCTATITAGGDTVGSAASTGAAALADDTALTLGAAADLPRDAGDIILCEVESAAAGENTSALSFVVELYTQPTAG